MGGEAEARGEMMGGEWVRAERTHTFVQAADEVARLHDSLGSDRLSQRFRPLLSQRFRPLQCQRFRPLLS